LRDLNAKQRKPQRRARIERLQPGRAAMLEGQKPRLPMRTETRESMPEERRALANGRPLESSARDARPLSFRPKCANHETDFRTSWQSAAMEIK
jgi:hypothetical protein